MLTERAVRLYCAKGLCEPGQKNGIMDFSNEDVRKLMDIACPRQLDFSIDQIRRMLEDPQHIQGVLSARIEEVQERMAHDQDILDALTGCSTESVSELVRSIELAELAPPEPNFSYLDEFSAEEKEKMTLAGKKRI